MTVYSGTRSKDVDLADVETNPKPHAPLKLTHSQEQGVGGIPLALRQAEVADPGAAGSGAVGGPGRGPGPVIHAYEEYMHDMVRWSQALW